MAFSAKDNSKTPSILGGKRRQIVVRIHMNKDGSDIKKRKPFLQEQGMQIFCTPYRRPQFVRFKVMK